MEKLNFVKFYFKLCLSSDKVSKLNEKKCALNLYKNKKNEDVSFEMNLDQLDEFILTLETIEKVNMLI